MRQTDAKAFPNASAVCVPPDPSLEVGAAKKKKASFKQMQNSPRFYTSTEGQR